MIELNNGEEYISYLRKEKQPFDKDKIITILDGTPSAINKPHKAFWGSPINAEFGWKEWCYSNEMWIDEYDWSNPVVWKLQTGSKILKVDSLDVMSAERSCLKKYLANPFPTEIRFSNPYFMSVLNFELMYEDGITAVQLMNPSIGHMFWNDYELESMFNSWDCESIVVLDKAKIEFI